MELEIQNQNSKIRNFVSKSADASQKLGQNFWDKKVGQSKLGIRSDGKLFYFSQKCQSISQTCYDLTALFF